MTRPPGRKAEKRKMKRTTINEPTPFADLIQKMMDDKKERDEEKKLELLKQKIEVALEKERENLRRRTIVHRSSIQCHAIIYKGRISGHYRLYNDYFSENPVYIPSQFRRRFRIRKCLFLRIVTTAVRMLAYGVAADAVDYYVRIAESTSIESLKKFVQAIIAVFGNEYLRTPNSADICRLLSEGLPGSHNDINVLDRYPIFLAEGRTPSVNYLINGHEYTTGYYLADNIYPSWATFVKTIPCPNGLKATNFAAAQESARKDVERAFGVLQACFAIVCGPIRFWDRQTLQYIMKACIIMHNMIIEDERDQSLPPNYDAREGEYNDLPMSRDHTVEF
ncbi:putative nuclease HARBI1 [Cinnamomum micranthum f. kanehirae]|uniref:Putative nuclease HARBI1 n=1 Tax=Cinnamomum micranthum f. kanehirae TaxID=337451 RepID=A0A3S3PK11_9MAGN|nr:putative nuclease HARBI1 [Cinnamomum micranthum f. kanehirae]